VVKITIKHIEAAKKRWANPEYREKVINGINKLWENQNYKELRKQQRSSPEYKLKIKKIFKESWENPEYRKNHLDAQKKLWSNEEFKRKQLKKLQDALKKPEIQKKMEDSRIRIAKDPEIQARKSKSLKEYCSKPENIAKRTGSNSPTWKGGKSFEPYCFKFNESFKEKTRKKFNYLCFECESIEVNKAHSIHHIDYNKNSICQGKEWAFIPLCSSCHTKTNYNRWFWFNKYINYWLLNEDINFGGEI